MVIAVIVVGYLMISTLGSCFVGSFIAFGDGVPMVA